MASKESLLTSALAIFLERAQNAVFHRHDAEQPAAFIVPLRSTDVYCLSAKAFRSAVAVNGSPNKMSFREGVANQSPSASEVGQLPPSLALGL